MDQALFARFTKCAVEVLSVDATRIVPRARFDNDLEADSLDLVELVMVLEEEFDIEIAESELENISTVGEAIALLERLVKPTERQTTTSPNAAPKTKERTTEEEAFDFFLTNSWDDLLIAVPGATDRPLVEEVLRLQMQQQEGLIDDDTFMGLLEMTSMSIGASRYNEDLKRGEWHISFKVFVWLNVFSRDRFGNNAPFVAAPKLRAEVIEVCRASGHRYSANLRQLDNWWQSR